MTASTRHPVTEITLDDLPDGRLVITVDVRMPCGRVDRVQVRGDLFVPIVGALEDAPSLLLEFVPRSATTTVGPTLAQPVERVA